MEGNGPKKFSFFLKGGPKGVLLIHGITGTPSEMHYLGRVLNKAGYTVLCNTLPCHCGTLGELKKVTWEEIAESCAQDLNTLKLDCSQVFVGGLSMGALMAIHLAYKFSNDVSGIICLAPTLFYDGWALHKGKIFLNIMWHIPFLRNRINIREDWPYGLKDERSRENIQRFYKNAKASEFDNKVLLFGSPFFPVACLYQHHLFAKVVKKEIPSVNKPVLIIHARQDDMTSLKNPLYILNNISSQDKTMVTLEDSYHMITIDMEKDKVAQEIAKFLDKF